MFFPIHVERSLRCPIDAFQALGGQTQGTITGETPMDLAEGAEIAEEGLRVEGETAGSNIPAVAGPSAEEVAEVVVRKSPVEPHQTRLPNK